MAVSKTAGTRFYIGPDVNPDTIEAMIDADAVTYFEGLSGWTEVEEIESFGDLGDNSEVATFASVKDRRMRKFKTIRDAGTMVIVCGRDPLDAGQVALVAAEKADLSYAFKIVYADHRDADHTDSVEYFAGMVMSRPTNLGDKSAMTKNTFNIGVETAVYAVPSDSSVVPVNLVLPSIIGTQVRVGYTLTAVEGEWTGEPTSYTYQWQHDVSGNGTFGNVSVGGTSRTYVPVVGDIADSLRVQVTAVNGAGSSTAANSLGTIGIIAA
jgi:ribosomal protein L19